MTDTSPSIAPGARDQDREFLDSALQHAPLAFAFFDTGLRFLRVNEAFTEVSGVSAADHVGLRAADLLPAIGGAVEERLRTVLECGWPVVAAPLVGSTPRSGGKPRRWSATLYPVRALDGNVLALGCILLDVTDAMLLEEEFRQSQKLEAVGRLASTVAHDFNNLLTIIRAHSDLALLDSAADDPRRLPLIEIRSAAESAGRLSRQLLALSRRNTGVASAIDLNLLVRQLSEMLRRVLPENVSTDLALDESLWMVRADPGQIEQILMNLITNAIDAMPSGGVLTVQTANETVGAANAGAGPAVAPGDWVAVRVSDTGEGMDEPTKARLFEPLFTTKAADKGSGLGLATVQQIVRRLGGQVSVTSAPGQGSTFTIHLPRVRETATPAVTAAQAEARTAKASATILIAEDEDAVRSTLVTMLERSGYAVIAANGGAAALRAAADHCGPVDLLLADLMMPDMDGRQLAAQVKLARPEIKVLIMSGYDEQSALAGGSPSGLPAFLAKPFTMAELIGQVEHTLHPAAHDATG